MNNTTNPYRVGVVSDFALKQPDVSSQTNQFKREDDMAKAPLVMPFPLENVLIPLIGDVFISLTQARNKLIETKQNPAVDTEDLDSIVTKIDEINKHVLDLQTHVRKITL